MDPQTREAVEAPLNYLAATITNPYTYRFPPPAGVQATNSRLESHPLRIQNGRLANEAFGIDLQGFMLIQAPSAVRNFYDDAELRAIYYPEIEALLKTITGAEEVLIFDYTLRNFAKAKAGENNVREPVRSVHNDYTERSAAQRVRDLLAPEEAQRRLQHRFAEVNVWRPIKGPVEETPLTICDARTIGTDDLVANQLRYRDRNGETYSARYNPNHRWFYFPRMQTDEVVLLKCFDSARDGRARFTIHSAFDDPDTPPNSTPRESIEVRVLLFFSE